MKAWGLLNKPEKWVQGSQAVNSRGQTVFNVRDPEAVAWCMTGAVRKCYGLDAEVMFERLRATIGGVGGIQSLTAWNDAPRRTWKEVHELLKEEDI